MRVCSICLDGFRNYTNFSASFDPGVNVIWGENAQGKTNLLEAIGFLSGARSHRARGDRELISFQRDQGTITAQVDSRDRTFLIEAQLARGRRRKLLVNHVKLKTAAELTGIVQTVLFCPEDLALIKSGAAERRAFLDHAICQLRPRYGGGAGPIPQVAGPQDPDSSGLGEESQLAGGAGGLQRGHDPGGGPAHSLPGPLCGKLAPGRPRFSGTFPGTGRS
ncbi:MAG: DNA replication/repair protein RecF [Evtepia gabavorous]